MAAGELGFLSGLPAVSAQEVKGGGAVKLRAEIEPVVRLLEDTDRGRLLEEVGARVRAGTLSYREILSALQLAGVRNIQPRPVGFKFHAVLVVNSAHLAAMAGPAEDRWLPIFWALDQFKSSQARDVQEGDWTMAAVDEGRVPPVHKAKRAFVAAMENWDEAAADVAAAGFVRGAGAHEVFEVFARLGARDWRDIGHKAIYVANSWRALQAMGWEHAEPVLRSLAYALLMHEGDNPAERDADVDRPWRQNLERAREIPRSWRSGRDDRDAAWSLMAVLREGSPSDASEKVVSLLQAGVGPQAVWDVLMECGGELLMRVPGILTLHSLTTLNALYFAYRTVGDDETRKMMLLQAAAFLPFFRREPEDIRGGGPRIDTVAVAEGLPGDERAALEAIFADVSGDKNEAARKVLGFCQGSSERGRAFVDEARRYLFLKGNNSHDYKFTSAVLEDYGNVSPVVRDRFLAASVFNLKGSGHRDSGLVGRTREALSAG